ncbi:MAG: hypothetical protein WC402_05840, partial [Candidatus Pacearchaeota archaeon]
MKLGHEIKLIILIGMLFLLINSTTALGVYPLCLTKGQTARFSLCNPAIADRVCTKNLCQYCVSEIRTGIYCPASLNACNSGSGTCVYINDPDPTPTPVSINITLTEPINNYNITVTSTNSISFKFKVTNSSLLSYCNLFINDNQFASNQTKLSLSVNIIQINVNPGS